ncbi:MAG: Do family serine endopeptidase [Hyphomonadaceae bacterium]|nr:Do family serine endopeptidase [Hyphomonadaceae bacterium]
MKRGVVIGAASGLVAGVSLATLALAAPSWATFGHVEAAALSAPVVAQLAAPVAAQQAWGAVPNLADLVEKVSPSVVKIEVRSPNENAQRLSGPGGNPFEGTPFQDFFQRGFPGQGQQGQQGEQRDMRGSGSGFVIQGGYIVTNNHVVDNAKSMTVILDDGRELAAKLVGTDPKTDLAVIKVEGANIAPALPWGDSNRARPGDNVFAMGSPFGLGNTVTAGIVSARGRSLGQSYDDYIQVDAPINQGNSGGPLFNTSGQVIGVNSAIYSPTGGNVGIGFSIPAELAQNIVQQIITNGSVERGWLGVGIQPITPDIASSLNLAANKGAMVNQVTDGSPAQKAGLKERDIILSFGDREINHLQDLTRAVADTKAGATKDVKILRDGRQQTVKVKIAPLKVDQVADATDASPTPGSSAKPASLTLSELGLGLATSDDGLYVTNVKVNSGADDAQIRQGDKIVSVNQVDVKSPEAARKAVEDAKKQKRAAVLLQVERNGTRFFVGVPFSES